VRHHFLGPASILDRERINVASLRPRAKQYHRNRAREIQQRLRVEIGRHRDHSVDPPAHGANRRLDAVPVGVRSRDQQMKAIPLCRVVHAANDFREEFSIEVRQKNAECLGLARDETARSTVGDVAHSSCDFVYQAPGFLTYWSALVQNSRDCGDGHFCFTSDVLDRDHSPRNNGPLLESLSVRVGRREGQLSCWSILPYSPNM